MNDDRLDQAVRDADPYRPVDLHGAEQTLLEEIMTVDRAPWKRRLVAAMAAAAALIAILAVSVTLRPHRTDSPKAAPATTTTMRYSAFALKAAEQNPRLLIHEDGWKITSVYGFAKKSGSIQFVSGDHELGMTWYAAGDYTGYYKDRLQVSAPQAVEVDGWSGNLFKYSDSDFAVMLEPRDGVFVELRTSGKWDRAEFDRVLGKVVRVDVPTWLAALPPEIVTDGKVAEAANKALAGVPLPPGFDIAKLDVPGANDPYQFGATVVGKVGCGWIAEWIRADKAGDGSAKEEAAAALRGSHGWKVLDDMNAQGDYPEVFWEIADRVAAGSVPDKYQQSLGC